MAGRAIKPKCRYCRKTLVWDPNPQTTRVKRAGRCRYRASRDWSRLAYRCTDCQGIFCRSCAHKHFAPIRKAQRGVDKVLERLAVAAMRKIGTVCT